jgi:tRNA uridine 5-carboxymethylaminomethyl modification enzyme
MFTSRAEHRLLLNHNSAELRLIEPLNVRPVTKSARREFLEKKRNVEEWTARFEELPAAARSWGT